MWLTYVHIEEFGYMCYSQTAANYARLVNNNIHRSTVVRTIYYYLTQYRYDYIYIRDESKRNLSI